MAGAVLTLVLMAAPAHANSLTDSLADAWNAAGGALKDAFATFVTTVKDKAE